MIVTRAPLRIPLGGGGTDYPAYYLNYGGFLLSFALDKYVHVVLHDTIDSKIRLKYSKTEEVNSVDELQNRVAAEALKWYGITSGIEVATFSDVPEASGLGGSSSFCVALVTALRCKLGIPLIKEEIFKDAYDIERNKAGQSGGIQDQFFASYGGAWSLRLNKEVARTPAYIYDLLPKLKLVYTGTHRKGLDIANSQAKKVKEYNSAMLDNLETVKSIGYYIETCLRQGMYDEIGETFDKHWRVKKERDPNISNSETDKLYEEALSKGALGGKLLGLGGGGYLLLYSNKELEGMNCFPVGIDTEGCKVVYQNGKI
jgi:D-glycero-alpha-D-manno-heptose-7-phosphate kinase